MVLKPLDTLEESCVVFRLNPTVVVLKLDTFNTFAEVIKMSQSNRSGFETTCIRTSALGTQSLNPTVVVLKLASKGCCRECGVCLNPTVVVLKPVWLH